MIFQPVLGGGTRVQSGSYEGSGLFGQSTPNTLQFSFKPLVVFISGEMYDVAVTAIYGCPTVNNNQSAISVIWEGNTMVWYNNASQAEQLNLAGVTYHWVALG